MYYDLFVEEKNVDVTIAFAQKKIDLLVENSTFNSDSFVAVKDSLLANLEIPFNRFMIDNYVLLPKQLDNQYDITWEIIDSDFARLIHSGDQQEIVYDVFEYEVGYKSIRLRASITVNGNTISRDWKCLVFPLSKGMKILKINQIPALIDNTTGFVVQGTIKSIPSSNNFILQDETGTVTIYSSSITSSNIGDFITAVIDQSMPIDTKYYLKTFYLIPKN